MSLLLSRASARIPCPIVEEVVAKLTHAVEAAADWSPGQLLLTAKVGCHVSIADLRACAVGEERDEPDHDDEDSNGLHQSTSSIRIGCAPCQRARRPISRSRS